MAVTPLCCPRMGAAVVLLDPLTALRLGGHGSAAPLA